MNILRVKKIKSILIYYDIFKVTFTHAHIVAHRSEGWGIGREGREGDSSDLSMDFLLTLTRNQSEGQQTRPCHNPPSFSTHLCRARLKNRANSPCFPQHSETSIRIHQTSEYRPLCALIGYSSLRYPVSVYIRPVKSVFRTLWLATQAWDIRHYPLVCKAQWTRARVITIHFVSLAIRWFGIY